MEFQIYDILDLRQKIEIDLSDYLSLDHYLYLHPLLKRLVYAYIKKYDGQEKLKLSKVHEIFKDSDKIEFYDNRENTEVSKHEEFYESDEIYKYVYNKYVKNPEIWINGPMSAQGYFFDAKKLLFGDTQKKINEVVNLAISSANLHYSVALTNFYNYENFNFYQKWFDLKSSMETDFFNMILNRFVRSTSDKSTYKIQCYHDIIEIYDTETSLTLQMTLKHNTNTALKILMPKEAIRSTMNKRNTLVSKFLMKCEIANKIYRSLIDINNLTLINAYLDNIDNLTNLPQMKLMTAVVKTFLEDLRGKEKSTYFDTDWLTLQMVHKNVVERNSIHFSEKNALLRIYRKINYTNDSSINEIILRPYSIPKNLDRAAKLLINHGFITFSRIEEPLNQLTFENLANRKTVNHAKLFMRLPIIDAKIIYDFADVEIIKLQRIIHQHLKDKEDLIFEDTREFAETDKNFFSYYETMSYFENPIEFNQKQAYLLTERKELFEKFLFENKGLLTILETIAK